MNMKKIIYIYDALCGWCYGFSPVIEKIFQEYKNDFKFEVLSGGMITGDRVGPIGEVAPYIKQAYKQVEATSGVKFGDAFLTELENGKAIFTSIPPAMAMNIFKQNKPDEQVLFAAELQKMIYHEGIAPDNTQAYAAKVEQYGLDKQDFLIQMNNPDHKNATEKEFQKVARFGVRGFPTMIAQIDEKYYMLSNGYTSYDLLKEQMEQFLQMESSTQK